LTRYGGDRTITAAAAVAEQIDGQRKMNDAAAAG
jgi:hypothetical protein